MHVRVGRPEPPGDRPGLVEGRGRRDPARPPLRGRSAVLNGPESIGAILRQVGLKQARAAVSHELRHRTRWTIALRLSDLPGSVKGVGWALATWTNTDGETLRDPLPPSLPELAEGAGCNVATVKRALARLEAGAWLYRDKGGGAGRRTIYQLCIPVEAEAALAAYLPAKRAHGAPVSGPEQAQGMTRTGAPAGQNRRTAEHGSHPSVSAHADLAAALAACDAAHGGRSDLRYFPSGLCELCGGSPGPIDAEVIA